MEGSPMIRWCLATASIGLAVSAIALPGEAAELTPAERGRKALLEQAYNSAMWSAPAFTNAWRQWQDGTQTAPADYGEAFRRRYGLHPAPYPNGDYPMGLRPVRSILGAGLTTDCMLCHGGSIMGQSYVGLPNSTIDMQAFYEELSAADGRSRKTPFTFTNVRGTTEAGSMSVYLFQLREPDLKMRSTALDLGLRENLCEEPPAWWLLRKKKTMYHTGSSDTRSVRSLMQFMLSPFNTAASIQKAEAAFVDIRQYILSLEPPRYPFAIDRAMADKGEVLFRANCAKCHGTYGANWTYPNKVVPLDTIGTDRTRYDGISERMGEYYNHSWFAQDGYPAQKTAGYQAPPLDGIWATAPYLHNGSVPTVYHMLNSKARPEIYTRSFRTGKEDYDSVKLGWKVQVLDRSANSELPAIERRRIYDTTLPGRGNGGHTFGDALTEGERWAVIEYLKTL
jgi:mono/diheme cytochrome c family protein